MLAATSIAGWSLPAQDAAGWRFWGAPDGLPESFVNATTIDPAGYDVTLAGELSGSGGLTLTGSGTLSLTAANIYSGNTIVDGGTLLT